MQYNRVNVVGTSVVAAVCAGIIAHDLYPKTLQSQLTSAVENSDAAAVQSALAHGANPNSGPFLMSAVRRRSAKVVDLLIKAGVSPNGIHGNSPLATALGNGDVAIADLLLEAGANPLARGESATDPRIRMTAMESLISQASPRPHSTVPRTGVRADVQVAYRMLLTAGVMPTLCQAIEMGDARTVSQLIANGADVNVGDASHGSALALAVDLGNTEIVSTLLKAHADIQRGDRDHPSAITEALLPGRKSALKLLLTNGANLKAIEAAEGYDGVTRILRRADSETYGLMRASQINPDIHAAIEFNDIKAVSALISKGEKLNSPDTGGVLPLEWCVRYDRYEIAKMLISAGATPDVGTAMWRAIAANRVAMAELLASNMKNIDRTGPYFHMPPPKPLNAIRTARDLDDSLRMDRSGSDGSMLTPLELAAEQNRAQIYAALRKLGAHDNLYSAASMGDLQRVQELLLKGEGINNVNSRHDSALTLALERGHDSLAIWLVENGADTDTYGSSRECPLAMAARHGRTELVNTMLEHGAAVNGNGPNRLPALVAAINAGNTEMANLLISRGANVNARSTGGRTCLMLAVIGHRDSIVSLLLDHGADVTMRSDQGETAITLSSGSHVQPARTETGDGPQVLRSST